MKKQRMKEQHMKTPDSWWLNSQGLRLRVWELGCEESAAAIDDDPGADVPVILLHGFLDHGLSWARVGPALGRRRVLALDQRGFGGSDRVGPGAVYHFPDYIADLDALVSSLDLGAVDLVGHSMGGTVAAWFAGARPQAVRRLALVEGMGPMAPTEDDALGRLRLFLNGVQRPPMVPLVRDLAHAGSRLQRRHPGLSDAHARLLAQHGTTPTADGTARRWSFDRRHMLRTPTPFRPAYFAQALAAIQAPTLAVWGADGWYADDVKAHRLALLDNGQQITLAGGHMLPYQSPGPLAQALGDHLRGPDRRPRR